MMIPRVKRQEIFEDIEAAYRALGALSPAE